MLRIGCHLSSSKGYCAMAKDALKIHANTFQYFSRNPRGGNAKALDQDDISRFLLQAKANDIHPFLAHAPYTLNGCSADPALRDFAKRTMADDLARLESTPGNLYNFHPGSHVKQGTDVGISYIADMLNEILKPDQTTTVLLETMSGQGTSLGATLEECTSLCASAGDLRRVGVCLDLCHLFAAGYELRTPEGYERLVGTVERELGLDAVGCWHLNDSKDPKGSRKDRHAHPGSGALGMLPFSLVVSDRRFSDVPAILETPADRGKENLALLRKWRGRE